MPDLTVLAVDPATCTGWACSDGTSGAEDFGVPRLGRRLEKLPEAERHGVIGARFIHWLGAQLTRTEAGVLLVERQMTHHRAHLLVGLRMLALVTGWQRKLLVEEVWTSQWKPWAYRCGWWIKDDETDAKAMLGYFQEERLPRMMPGA